MYRIFITIALALLCSTVSANERVSATTPDSKTDTVRVYNIDGVAVKASSKETTSALKIPSAATNIGLQRIEALDIDNIKNLSSLAPNLFIANYGSPLTTPIYIRGIGTRGSGQSVAIYIDGAPLLDKSVFDMERLGISHIEVLRGPQGTLYGRNAMGGVINIQTHSPLDYQGTRIKGGGGAYNSYNLSVNSTFKVCDNIGIGLSSYYNSTGGYFTNSFNGKKIDNRNNMGGALRFDWAISPKWRLELSAGFDFTDGGAFAYGLYDKASGITADPNYDAPGSYKRSSSNNSLRVTRDGDEVLFSSTTSYQWLSDDMFMDQDFTKKSIFTLNQRQLQNAVSQELAWRSMTTKDYQWSAGAFGFYSDMETTGDVTFGQDGTKFLESVFNTPNNPMSIRITDKTVANPGLYKTPTWGAALFHQSTFNNLLTEGLSLTVGIRFDYEKQYIDYNTAMAMDLGIFAPGPPRPPVMTMNLDTLISGSRQQDSFEWLPKFSLRYECGGNASSWVTISKGYKAGGYNVQMFSEVAQRSMQEAAYKEMGKLPMPNPMPQPTPIDLNQTIAYSPEVTWSYEVGTRADLFDKVWSLEVALFYMDINDVQVTRFVDGGSGRVLSNAASGTSYGAEFATTIRPLANRNSLRFDVNYGFNQAKFRNYNNGKSDYSGNFIPYTPQHTFSATGIYTLPINSNFFTGIDFVLSYNGAGKIYWNEANDVSQDFYGLLDAKVVVKSNIISLELWANNILDTKYGSFYFESFDNSFIQQGLPMTFGANLIITL